MIEFFIAFSHTAHGLKILFFQIELLIFCLKILNILFSSTCKSYRYTTIMEQFLYIKINIVFLLDV